jgi:serine/threonine protein kinase
MISILCVAFVREASPFVRASTNVLLNIAQYQILVTFFGAFIIMTDALDVLGLSDIALGLLLFCSNFFIVILVAFWSFKRYWIEKMKQRWRRALNAKELQILNKVMADQKFHDDDDQSPRKLGDHLKNSQSLSLEQYIIAPKHVVMKKKIGSGAFGEVFKGTCRGETVAIKTMINVTVETAKLFKGEIMLTAQLKHPNIVNFIGCCYGQELACLILEFVKRGTLGDMLKGEESHDLDWMDPLLKLATEIAQGMAYLHGTKQTEGNPTATVQDKEIILHRDLKPDNVLISEFVSAKITDFGTSRTKETRNDVTMSGVGTPLFCAPEISRGEIYDEKVDVYSFGLILLDMATEEDLIDFIGERWRQHFKKKSKPKQAMKFIRTMSEEGWRPITPTHLEKLRNKSKNQNSLENNQRRPSTQNGDFCNEDDVGFVAHVLPYAPLSIISLIIECTDHDPKKRPSFIDIVEEMKTKCYKEINTFQYYEQVEKNRSSFYLLHPELQHRDHSFHHSFHTQFQRDHQGEHQAEHRPEQQRDSQEGKHQVQSSFEFVIADMEQHRLEEEEKRVKEANETHNNWFLEAFL